MCKMRNKLAAILLAAVTILSCTAATAADTGNGARYLYPVVLDGDSQYKAVQLEDDLYTRAAPELVNLRVVDSQGNAIPYFLYDAEASLQVENAAFPGEAVYHYVEEGDSYHDFSITKKENEDVYGNSLVLHTGSDNFAKEVDVWGSHDGTVWKEITQAVIFRVEGRSQLEIPFDATEKYSYYRIRVPNDQEDIVLPSVELRYQQTSSSSNYFGGSLSPAFLREEQDGLTRITVEAQYLRNLRLTALELDTDSMFQRQFRTSLARETLYNLTFQGLSLRNTTLLLPGTAYGERDFVLEIVNGDDTPIELKHLTFFYRCDLAVFKAEPGETYYLVLEPGNTAAPTYDIAGYADLVLSQGVDMCGYGPALAEDTVNTQNSSLNDSWIFHGALILASVMLIFLIVRTSLRKNQENSNK